MWYLGGKQRISNEISRIINEVFGKQEQNFNRHLEYCEYNIREREREYLFLFSAVCVPLSLK